MATRLIVKGSPTMYALREATVPVADWIELKRCPICESDRLTEIGRVATLEGDLGPVTSVCRCGHGFMRRRPSPDWFGSFYVEDWDARGRLAVARGRGLRTPSRSVHEFCAGRLRGDERILDAGAGLGDQLAVFLQHGFAAEGLERSEHRAAFVRERLGVECETTPLERYEAKRPFDLVFSNHVLEHVDDPSAFIAHSRRLLAPDGLLYVAVPNLWAEYPPQALHFVPHLSMFTLASLQRLLTEHGMRVIESAVTRELQVLAKPTAGGSQAPSTEPGEADFVSRIARWTSESVGCGNGDRRTLVWWTAKTATGQYASRALGGAGMQAFRAGLAVRGALPARVTRRLLPPLLRDPTLRSLEVEIAPGSSGSPLAFVHERRSVPIWVK